MARKKAADARSETLALIDWNNKWKQEAEEMKKREAAYYAHQATVNDHKRREKEDALAEYFWQLSLNQDQKYREYV